MNFSLGGDGKVWQGTGEDDVGGWEQFDRLTKKNITEARNWALEDPEKRMKHFLNTIAGMV